MYEQNMINDQTQSCSCIYHVFTSGHKLVTMNLFATNNIFEGGQNKILFILQFEINICQ
jgi:hypothetical protein